MVGAGRDLKKRSSKTARIEMNGISSGKKRKVAMMEVDGNM